MKDFDLYIAKTQARLAFFLIIILVLLSFGVVGILLLPKVNVNQEIIGLVVQVVTGVLGLAGSAVAYFFARHRPPTASDEDNSSPKIVTATVENDSGSKASVTSAPAPLVPTPPEKSK
jgi:hypothetical protein